MVFTSINKPRLLSWCVSEWSTPEAARDFYRLYQKALRSQVETHGESLIIRHSEISGSGDPGDFLLRISGASVLSIEGIPHPKKVL